MDVKKKDIRSSIKVNIDLRKSKGSKYQSSDDKIEMIKRLKAYIKMFAKSEYEGGIPMLDAIDLMTYLDGLV